MTLDNDYLVLNGLIFSLENEPVNWREVKSGEWPVILKENWLIAKNQDETLHLLADKSDTLMVAGGKLGHQLYLIATTNFNRDPTKRNPIKWANACFLDKNSILVSEWNGIHLFNIDQFQLGSSISSFLSTDTSKGLGPIPLLVYLRLNTLVPV